MRRHPQRGLRRQTSSFQTRSHTRYSAWLSGKRTSNEQACKSMAWPTSRQMRYHTQTTTGHPDAKVEVKEYAVVAGRVFCRSAALDAWIKKEGDVVVSEARWMMGKRPKKLSKADWIAALWTPVKKPGGTVSYNKPDEQWDWDRMPIG